MLRDWRREAATVPIPYKGTRLIKLTKLPNPKAFNRTRINFLTQRYDLIAKFRSNSDYFTSESAKYNYTFSLIKGLANAYFRD